MLFNFSDVKCSICNGQTHKLVLEDRIKYECVVCSGVAYTPLQEKDNDNKQLLRG